ncbi:MAG TPA: DUF2059 domain-containing protein [Polyangiaceae bacterium]|jgi:hypothetical protein|nr:DUF2059 domain-containing protein [Polyangiaceae bacterium]
MKTYAIGLMLALGMGAGVGASVTTLALAEAPKNTARELTQLMLPKDGYQKMMQQMSEGMVQGMSRGGTQLPKDFPAKMMTVVQEALPYEEQVDFMTKVYASRFTDAELKDMIAFYKTPTGGKLVRELPGIMRESALWASQLLPQRLPELMKKHGIGPDSSGAKAPPPSSAPNK